MLEFSNYRIRRGTLLREGIITAWLWMMCGYMSELVALRDDCGKLRIFEKVFNDYIYLTLLNR